MPQPDLPLTRVLENLLREEALPFSKGLVWTTDAPYRETIGKVKTYQDQGVLAVEMEMSALMTVAAYRSVPMVGALIVSDELFDLHWRPGFSEKSLMSSSRKAGEILLSLAQKLSP
jgi:purine-nucleoside phosphorylase